MRHKTPLRYPGGKQRLAPFILELLEANDLVGGHYVEPYAGGAGVAMDLLIDGHVSCVHLNDSSYPIYAFWKSVKSFPEELCRLISRTPLSVEQWQKQRLIVQSPDEHDVLTVGFATFYLNRCNRSGVLTGGVIGGLTQKGEWKIDARFPRAELIARVEAIARQSKSIRLRNWDAEKFIRQYIPKLPMNTLVYCDPPYYERSSRLYLDKYSDDDHARVAKLIQSNLNHSWIVSYDKAPQVLNCYRDRRRFIYDLQYNASRVYVGREVFIFSDDIVIPKKSTLPYIDKVLRRFAS
jgi:DNA adenine methylase